MKQDPEVDKVFGWVLEMYAYATAARMHNVRHILRKDFMVQPPWDTAVGAAYIIHYTYGMDYNLKGEHMYGKYGEWRFDKRSYSSGAPPKVLALPPKGTPSSVVRGGGRGWSTRASCHIGGDALWGLVRCAGDPH